MYNNYSPNVVATGQKFQRYIQTASVEPQVTASNLQHLL